VFVMGLFRDRNPPRKPDTLERRGAVTAPIQARVERDVRRILRPKCKECTGGRPRRSIANFQRSND